MPDTDDKTPQDTKPAADTTKPAITQGSATTDAGDFVRDPGAAGKKSLTEGAFIDALKLIDWLRREGVKLSGSVVRADVLKGQGHNDLADKLASGWRPE